MFAFLLVAAAPDFFEMHFSHPSDAPYPSQALVKMAIPTLRPGMGIMEVKAGLSLQRLSPVLIRSTSFGQTWVFRIEGICVLDIRLDAGNGDRPSSISRRA